MSEHQDCPFCGEPEIVVENELAFAHYDSYPVNAGHCLIITRRHVADYFQATTEEKAAIWSLVDEMKSIIDEEYTFGRLAEGDKDVQKELDAQDAALEGKDGGLMQTVSTKTGEQGPELKLESLPVWDGMAIARGQLFVAGKDGSVRCFGRGR